MRSIGGEPSGGFEELAQALDGIEDEASLTTLISERPDLFGAEMIAELDDLVAVPGLGVGIAPFLHLLEDAQADPGKAWQRFYAAMDVRAADLAQLSSTFVRGRELADEGNYDEAIELAEAALDEAYDKGHLPWAAEFHMLIAICLRQRGGNVRAELDEAIRHMTLGAEGAAHPYMRAEREMNLAALYGVRRNGDPKQNGEAALAILADALTRLDDDSPIGVRVMVLNNLMRGFQTREEDDRLTNLRRSLGYGEEARRLVSFSDDPATWGMVRVNLGETTKLLAGMGDALPDDAEAYFRQVADLDRQDELGTLIGVANAALGEMHLRAARKSAEENGRIGLGIREAAPPIASERVELDPARRHLELACGLIDPRQEGWHLGAALNHLAEVYLLLGEEKLELETNRRAVELQTAIATPGLLLDSASGLGFRHANRGEWAEAAEAFRTALEAGQTNVHARLENAGRRSEMERVGNIARWAALALAKTGELEAAILTLENGRTQDIRRRLGAGVDEQTLAALPEEARKDWEAAITKLSGTPPGVAADAAARELQEVIASIRQVAGFENFDTGSSFAQIAEAAEPGCPLLYVNPTPWGTAFLSVSCNSDGWDAGVRFADRLSGEDLQIDLMLRDPEDPVPRLSYFALAAGVDAPPAEERGAVEHAIDLLDPYGKAVAKHLDDLGARAVTLVACGPISLAPLHAAGWLEPDGARARLLDHYSVRSAPSATLQGVCIARANRNETKYEPTLLALGNPDLEDPELDLAGSETEVRDLAARFPPQQQYVALRAAARPEYFADHVEGATFIHLACHASGGLFGFEEAKLHLAGRPVSGVELETMPLSARLTVISACQTAVFDMANLPAEAASISTAMLVAGSAAVIATQWPVDDAATALLMSRFYEELFDRRASPADALRRSQAWLRDSEPSGRFAHPLFWAPFVLAGA